MSVEALRTSLNAQGERFLRWWGSTLADCVPAALRTRLAAGRSFLLRLETGRAELLSGGPPGRMRQRASVAFPADAPGTARDAIRRHVPKRTPIRLLLPAEAALETTVELPAQAAENLREVLAFEMDRFSPFRADAVWFDHRLLGRPGRDGKIQVSLVIVPSRIVASALATLGAWDLNPASIGVEGAEWAALSEGTAPPPPARRDWVTVGLAAAALSLLGAALILPLHREHQRLAALQAEAETLRARAAAVDVLRRKIEDRLSREASLADLRRTSSALPILAAASRLIPDHTWLNQIEVKGGRILMSGYSTSPSELIEPLENSPHFARVAFNGPVFQDPQYGKQRFSLSADLEGHTRPGNQ